MYKLKVLEVLMIQLQVASFEDLAEILELQKAAYQSEAELYREIVIPPMTQTLSELQEEYSNNTVYKLVYNANIVGSVRVDQSNDTCYINKLCVHPSVQGQGYGRLMMNEVERQAMTCTRFELFTGHRSLRNLNFYKRLGYTEFKQVMVNDSLTLIYMEKVNVGGSTEPKG